MPQAIVFAPGQDQATYTTGTSTVPTSAETDAIIIQSPDYLSTTTASVENNTQGTLYIDFTKGSLTNVIIKVYGSHTGTPTSSDWFAETVESTSSGTATLYAFNITLTADAKVMYHIPLGANRAHKITVQGTGTATSSSLKLYYNLRSN